jgi:hypothetical protein
MRIFYYEIKGRLCTIVKMFSTPIKIQSIALVIFTLCCKIVSGQNVRYFGYKLYAGKVLKHISLGEYNVNSYPQAHEIRWGQLLLDKNFKSLYRCNLNKGYLLNYTSFKDSRLGNAFILGYYLNPSMAIGDKFLLSIATSGGLAYTTKPNRSGASDQNRYYSTYLNFYGHLGVELIYKLNNRVGLSLGYQQNHLSNGGYKMPNFGINWITGSIGMNYNLTQQPEPYWLPLNNSLLASNHFEVATYIGYADLNITTSEKKYFINGVILQYGRRGILHGWNIGTELAYDPMHSDRAKIRSIDNASTMLWSVYLGHEFILGRLIFSQLLGYHLQSTKGIYKSPFYNRLGLVYPLTKKIGIGTNVKIQSGTALFVDFRVVYTVK